MSLGGFLNMIGTSLYDANSGESGMGGGMDGGLADLIAKIRARRMGNVQQAPVASQTPIAPSTTGLEMQQPPLNGASMNGLGIGLGSLLSRIGMRL